MIMNISVFIITLFLLQLVCFYIGKKASKKLETQEDYFLAGRSIRFFPLMMTLIATQIGGGLILGSAEEAYRFGWYVLLYPLGACLGLVLLAMGIGKRMSQFKVSTVAQLFEVVYQSPRLKQVASLLSISSLFLILIAQVIASKKFMLSLGVDQNLVFIGFWAIVIIYTVMGGLKAVVATDIIQAAFFIFVFLLGFCFTLSSEVPAFVDSIQVGLGDHFDFNAEKLTGWLLMPLFFMVIEQDMGQRCFAAKNGRTVSIACWCAAACTLLVCVIPVYYGILGKTLDMAVAPGSSVFMAVIRESTNPTITALIGCAILAAIISTADSLINAISSNISQDFAFKNRGNIKTARWITSVIAILAFAASFAFHNVVDLLILSYELSVSCLFVPVFAALFIKRGNAISATLGILLGALGFILFRYFPLDFVPRELASLGLSLAGYCLGELLEWKTFRREVLKS